MIGSAGEPSEVLDRSARLGPVDKRGYWALEYAWLVVPLFVGLAAALTKLASLAMDRAARVGVPAAIMVTGAVVLCDPERPGFRRPRRSTLVLMGRPAALLLSQLAVVALLLRRIGLDLVPRVGSSDFGSHGGIVTWIVGNQTVPSPGRWNASVSTYPPGGHLFAATLSWVTGLRPLAALWAAALVALVGTWGVLCTLGRRSSARHPALASGLTLAFVFAAYRYTVGIITYDFFFAQLFGQWIALAGVARVVGDLDRPRSVVPQSEPAAATGGATTRGVTTKTAGVTRFVWLAAYLAGAVLCYPQASVLLLGAVAATVLFGPLPRRVRMVLAVASLCAAGVFLAVLSRTVYWNIALLAGTPGSVASVRVADLGGPVALGLAAMGTLVLLVSVRRVSGAVAVLGALAGPLVVVLSMLLLRAGFPTRVDVADYRIVKNIYGLAPIAAVPAAIAAATAAGWLAGVIGRTVRTAVPFEFVRRDRRAGRWWASPLIGGVLACFIISTVRAPAVSVRRIYDQDLYRLGLSLPAREREQVGLVAPWVEVYVMRWAGIGRPITQAEPAEYPRSERWRAWPDPTVPADRLLVSGSIARQYSSLPGVRVERRVGSAVLLRRE
jgi:hypothetical protein